MSQLTASQTQDVPCQAVTVIKMDGSKFKVECLNFWNVTVTDLKTAIARHEHIDMDTFDLCADRLVLKSPELLNLSLRDAGILDSVGMILKE